MSKVKEFLCQNCGHLKAYHLIAKACGVENCSCVRFQYQKNLPLEAGVTFLDFLNFSEASEIAGVPQSILTGACRGDLSERVLRVYYFKGEQPFTTEKWMTQFVRAMAEEQGINSDAVIQVLSEDGGLKALFNRILKTRRDYKLERSARSKNKLLQEAFGFISLLLTSKALGPQHNKDASILLAEYRKQQQ